MEGYSYNYAFLKEWMQENNKNKSEILRALGTKNYLSLGQWMDGSVPVPVENMLRLCNTFKIPLEQFFFFNGMTAAVAPNSATDNDHVTPTGGWNECTTGGGSNQRRSTQPLSSESKVKEAVGTPWTGRASEQIVKQQEEINRLQHEVDRLNFELKRKQDSVEDREHRINDLCVQARTNEKLVISLTEQIDFMREQVRIAQRHSPADLQDFGTMVSEPIANKRKEKRNR